MAGFTVSSLTDYTEKATEILRAGVLYAEDLQNYDFQTGIKYKEYLNYVDVNPHVQAGACGLSASGDTTFTEKEIEVAVYAYRDQFCSVDLRKKALPLGNGTLKGDLGSTIEQSLTEGEIDAIKAEVDADLWLGTSGMIDGWFANVSACTGAISLDTYTGTTVTSSNIDEIVDDFLDNVTQAMWSRGILTLHCSVSTFNLYKRNRLDANYYRDQAADLGQMETWLFGYEGQVKIKGEAGLNGSNYMMLTWDKNLVIGTDEENEIAEAKWVYDEVTDYVWFKSSFKLGTQIKFCGELIHNMY